MKTERMARAFARLFIRNIDRPGDSGVRVRAGTLSSAMGLILNLLLFTGKFVVGTLTGSVSITADAVNNLSDAGSCVVVLAGVRMAGKPADEEHPFGHARIEYIATSAVAVVILSIGLELIKVSYNRILHPADTEFTLAAVLVLAVSIGVKLWMFLFNSGLGGLIGSQVMRATAIDSLSDVAATSAVLVSAVVSRLAGIRLDGYMGAAVAVFILYSGFKVLKGTLDSILGQGPSKKRVDLIESFIRGHEGVLDIHDLVIHDYGPDRSYASVHVEADANVDIMESHERIDAIERDAAEELGIRLVIHLDPVVRDDPRIGQLRQLAEQLIAEVDPSLALHDFRVVWGRTHKKLIFDVTAPFSCRMGDRPLRDAILARFAERDRTLQPVIVIDRTSSRQ
ncbi:MAG: cation transporter [Clostridia bacterium]|nr:cation transporter [Clostridia bacterium]